MILNLDNVDYRDNSLKGDYMALHKYLQQAWKKRDPAVWRARLVGWRKEPVTVRVEFPTRLDRAHALGYKAKQGVFIVRQRIPRGGRMVEKPAGGRTSKNYRQRLDLDKNYRTVAEQRAVSSYKNCEVVNSYFLAKDGIFIWYEVILADRTHPSVLADDHLRNVVSRRGRVERGLTSSARTSRGLVR